MKNELTDTQIALLIKNALEFNAQVVGLASLIYKRNIKPSSFKQAQQDFMRINKEYNKRINKILKITTEESA